MRTDPEEFVLFRVAEIVGRTRDELVETLTMEEFLGWVEYLRFKSELQEKAIDEAKQKGGRR